MEDMSAIITALSGAGGVGGGAGVAWLLLKTFIARITRENHDLAREVRDLREKDMVKLEGRVAAVERANAECPITQVEADLKNLLGWHKGNSLKLDNVQSTVDKLEAHRQDDREWMQNISKKIDRLG